MRKFNLLFLGIFLAYGVSVAQARVCLLPIPELCDLDMPEQGEGGNPAIQDPQPPAPVEICTKAGEYKTLEDCKKGIDSTHKCTKQNQCYIREAVCGKGAYTSLDACNKAINIYTIPTYSDYVCEKVEGQDCWQMLPLCSDENKATAASQGYTVSGEDVEAKTAEGSYCVQFINQDCDLYKCTKAEIGFHWVREEAQKRKMYLDCAKPENKQYCDNDYDHYSCQAGAEKHCKSLGSKMASRQDIWNYMDYINAKWKKWFPHHRDPSYNGWAMIFSQAYGTNLVPIFQVNDYRDGGDFFDTSGSNSTGCSLMGGTDMLNEDVGYYICIKELDDN